MPLASFGKTKCSQGLQILIFSPCSCLIEDVDTETLLPSSVAMTLLTIRPQSCSHCPQEWQRPLTRRQKIASVASILRATLLPKGDSNFLPLLVLFHFFCGRGVCTACGCMKSWCRWNTLRAQHEKHCVQSSMYEERPCEWNAAVRRPGWAVWKPLDSALEQQPTRPSHKGGLHAPKARNTLIVLNRLERSEYATRPWFRVSEAWMDFQPSPLSGFVCCACTCTGSLGLSACWLLDRPCPLSWTYLASTAQGGSLPKIRREGGRGWSRARGKEGVKELDGVKWARGSEEEMGERGGECLTEMSITLEKSPEVV